MKLLDKLFKKYNKNPKGNVPQLVYGIPDSKKRRDKMQGKYDKEPDKNIPAKLYGVPSPFGEESSCNKDKLDNYDVKPEDNVPEMVYGIPNFESKPSVGFINNDEIKCEKEESNNN